MLTPLSDLYRATSLMTVKRSNFHELPSLTVLHNVICDIGNI